MFKKLGKAFSDFTKNADILLKEATEHKNNKEYDKAIECLKRAYKSVGNTEYSVNTFIRLPQFLQLSGKPEEAWKEFNRLLLKGYPRQPLDDSLILMDKTAIYDKMRLFLQREGKTDKAIKYGVLSYCARMVALKKQKRKDELKIKQKKESFLNFLEPLLKKAKRSEQKDKIFCLFQDFLKNISVESLEKMGSATDDIVSK